MFTWPFHLITSIPSATVAGLQAKIKACRAGEAGAAHGRSRPRRPVRPVAAQPAVRAHLAPRDSRSITGIIYTLIPKTLNHLLKPTTTSTIASRSPRSLHVGTALRNADSSCQHHKTWLPSKTHDRNSPSVYWNVSLFSLGHSSTVRM